MWTHIHIHIAKRSCLQELCKANNSICKSEALCLKENETGILLRTQRSMVKAMCGVQQKDKNTVMDSMLMLDLNETIDHIVVAKSMHWNGYVLREDGHELKWGKGEERMVMCWRRGWWSAEGEDGDELRVRMVIWWGWGWWYVEGEDGDVLGAKMVMCQGRGWWCAKGEDGEVLRARMLMSWGWGWCVEGEDGDVLRARMVMSWGRGWWLVEGEDGDMLRVRMVMCWRRGWWCAEGEDGDVQRARMVMC